ncbi:baseplate protein [Geotalea uraniireducens]|uniref:Baseplate protein n=1 Tax=Geotalea uraniireducens TaxID=351604 RepID=A0ABM8EJ26_9BACT|nr:baseplate J/gp47 family protein [Geotalea uraniireducens]BDV42449.1 baseplate protein [Geotalea uraniireducens]
MSSLPEPSFIDRDPNVITAELVAQYETASGKVLQPAQPEMLLINLIAYRETLLRIAIQEAAKQNLLDYARFPVLDYLGELVGCERLSAQPARTTLRFTLVAPQSFDVVISAGTRVETKDGKVVFASEFDLTIPAGQATGDVAAVAEDAGTAGNGYLAGEVNNLLGTVPYLQSAANTATTADGADDEDDDRYRERIRTAPEGYSNAGSRGAYRFWAMSAHQDIVDVGITNPSDGVVNIYPLTKYGTPSASMLALVEAVLTEDKVRPLTDHVIILPPARIDFSIEVAVTAYLWADTATTQTEVEKALETYAATLTVGLAKDIVSSQVVTAVGSVYGVYDPVVTLKDSSGVAFTKRELVDNEWANCTATTVTMAGVTNG